MATNRADQHDLDKLNRWLEALEEGQPASFPVHAVFLVSGEDRDAHDSFRAFRTSFEEWGAGFEHLVILGQHGVSQAARAMRARLELPEGGGPGLVLITSEEPASVFLAPLPPGESSGSELPEVCSRALTCVDLARNEGGLSTALGQVQQVQGMGPLGQPLRELVSELIGKISPA